MQFGSNWRNFVHFQHLWYFQSIRINLDQLLLHFLAISQVFLDVLVIFTGLREIPSITGHQRIVQKIPENINMLSNYKENSKRKQRNIDEHCKT